MMKQPHEPTGGVPETQSLILLNRPKTDLPAPPVISYVETEDEDGSELPFRDYWRAVRKYWWVIASLVLLSTLASAIYVARQPDFYEARARVQVDSENNATLGAPTKDGSVIISNAGNDPAYFSTQLQVLTSSSLLHRVVKTLNLEQNEAFLHPQTTSTGENLLRMIGLNSESGKNAKIQVADEVPSGQTIAPPASRNNLVEVRRLAPYIGMLQSGLFVDPVKETRLGPNRETRLIDVYYKHFNPEVAAKVVNTLATIFANANLERKVESNNIADQFIDKRIAELQAKIRAGDQQLQQYAKNNQILSLAPDQNTVVNRLVGLNNELLQAENDRKLAEAERDANLSTDALDVAADTAAAPLEAKLNDLQQRRAELLVENTEEWPAVKEIAVQINELEKQIAQTRQRAKNAVVTNQNRRYLQAKGREDKLQAAYQQSRSETLTQNQAAITYRILEQEIATNRNLLDGLLQRGKETEMQRASLTGIPNNIHILDYALVPDQPAGPKRTQTMGIAFLLSLALGVGLALFLNYLDDSIHSTSEVERLLHLPALGAIPLVGGAAQRRLRPSFGALQRRNGHNNGNGRPLLINEDVRSPLAEAYRHLRTSVLMSIAGRAPKTLLVTSSQPGEGKTTTTVNTAMVLAQTGASVLIIDADMRHPSMHSIFNMENESGLSTYLSSEMSEAEAASLFVRTNENGLFVLTAGPPPPNPAELLGSEQMRRLINYTEGLFTHIIIDSPPTAYFTDSVIISLLVDGVLLVVHSGKSSREIVRHSRKVLQDVGAKIFGVVLNGIKAGSLNGYYYSRDYYYEATSKQ